MYKVLSEEINAIVWPTVVLTHTDKLKIMDIANAKTDPTENHQDNVATLPLGTQISSRHSPLIDT